MSRNIEVSDQGGFDYAFIMISQDESAGSCIVHLPADTSLKFDGIGRDDDGGFLRTETGSIHRLDTDFGLIDELLTKEDLLLQHLDLDGEFVNEYAIAQVEPENRIGFGA